MHLAQEPPPRPQQTVTVLMADLSRIVRVSVLLAGDSPDNECMYNICVYVSSHMYMYVSLPMHT